LLTEVPFIGSHIVNWVSLSEMQLYLTGSNSKTLL
jgi:hypothetical protein